MLSRQMRLLLFDIDGTLVRSNGAGKAVMMDALLSVFGTSGPSEGYQMAGKTDPLIIHDLLGSAGLSKDAIEAGLPAVYDLMATRGRERFGPHVIFACPGVPTLLQALAARDDVLLGLLTGNIELTAPLKLAAAGIDPTLFRVGAYGSDAIDRNHLPPFAWRRAAELTGLAFDGPSTVIIGDTPADIACARNNGAVSVAVASGSYSATTLAEYQPDHLLETLADSDAFLQLLTQGNRG